MMTDGNPCDNSTMITKSMLAVINGDVALFTCIRQDFLNVIRREKSNYVKK
jgi:hypothetical protein